MDAHGDLILHTAGGAVRLLKPHVYQEVDGVKKAIPGHYVLLPSPEILPLPVGEGQGEGTHQVGFQVAAYDTSKPLVIDPVLSYSTYLGGSGFDEGGGIAVDAAGNAYVTGATMSTNFPTASPLRPATGGGQDAFVAKLNAAGSALLYSTYLGGNSIDGGNSIAVDAAGNAYVTGGTFSTDFPTMSPFQANNSGSEDAFVTKLNAAGSALLYSTYLGGNSIDYGGGIAVDAANNAYITGSTQSTNFPTASPLQAANGGGNDAFVAKLNAAGSALLYSTYLGGSGDDNGNSIAVDAAGSGYVTGRTTSDNFPTVNPIQGSHSGGEDAFVAKLNATGSALLYSTYLGGSGSEDGAGSIAVDAVGNAYVTGITNSTNFPTANALQPTYGGGLHDGFVAKLNAVGSALVYSTYLGGSGDDNGGAITVDSAGNAYVTGGTASTDFPTVRPIQATNAGRYDVYVTKLNAAGSALVYSTYLGGSGTGDERGSGIAVDMAGNTYIIGRTGSTDFPTANPLQGTLGGSQDAFVAKIIKFPPTGTFAYITNGNSDTVSVIDTKTNTVTTTIPVGRGPFGVAVHPSGRFVYVGNGGAKTVSVIDTTSNTVIKTVGVDPYPTGLAVHPSGKSLYVATSCDPSLRCTAYNVVVIDVGTHSVVATVPLDLEVATSGGAGPVGVAVHPAGDRVYVVTGSDVVKVIDTTSHTITATIGLGATPGAHCTADTGRCPHGITIAPSGTFVYVARLVGPGTGSGGGPGVVSVINTATNTEAMTVAVGADPFGVTVHPSGSFVYVANPYSNTVSVISTHDHNVVATIPVGSYPFGIAVHPNGMFVYTTNFFGNSVSVIETARNGVIAEIGVGVNPYGFGQFVGPEPPTIGSFSATPDSGDAPVSVAFAVVASDPNGVIASVEWDFDGDGTVDRTTTGLTTSFTYTTAGTFTPEVTVVDDAGARASATTTVTVTDPPPETTITATPPALSNSASASFSFSATEAGSTFACQLDGSGFAACSSPKSYGGLADGGHTFQVRATDPAGNPDPTPASYTWTVDTTPPETTIESKPLALTNSPSASFSFSATEAGSSFLCSLDGAAFVACGSTHTLPDLADGVHTLQVRATDAAGNPDATAATYTWTVDTTLPVVTITSPGLDEVLTTSPATVMVLARDTVGVASVRVNSVSAALVAGTPQDGTWQAAVPVTLPVPVGGALTFTATATDQATNTASATTVVDNDGLAAVIDTDATAFSNDFSDMASGGTTTGTITARGGWTLRVAEVNPGGVQVSLAGAGTTARIATCAAGGAESVELDGASERATITCVDTTGSNTGSRVTADLATAPTTNPKIIVRNASGAIKARLSTGQTATVGSPITAGPANTEPVLVELVDSFDVPYGSFALDAAESVQVTVTPSNTVEVTVVSGTTTLTIAGHTTTLSAGQAQTFGTVAIDIKPGSTPNSINPRSQGKIPVAILSHATLDAPTQVDRASLTFGRTGDERSLAFCEQDGLQDVNGDGRLDLVCHFHTPAAGFQAGDTQGMLKGKTMAGVPLTGLDAVRIVPAR